MSPGEETRLKIDLDMERISNADDVPLNDLHLAGTALRPAKAQCQETSASEIERSGRNNGFIHVHCPVTKAAYLAMLWLDWCRA